MNRRGFVSGLVAAAAVFAMPSLAIAGKRERESVEYIVNSNRGGVVLKHIWLEVTTYEDRRDAVRDYERFTTIEEEVESRTFAHMGFLVTPDEVDERDQLGEESAAFTSEWDSLKQIVVAVRKESRVYLGAFVMNTEDGIEEALILMGMMVDAAAILTTDEVEDVTGNDWIIPEG